MKKNQYFNDGSRSTRQDLSDKRGAINANGASDDTKKVHRKKRQANPFYTVIRTFKIIFGAFDESEQNTSTKRDCLNLAVKMKSSLYPDSFRFWMDLLNEARILTDSVRFREECERLGLEYQAVAEHIVCEGKAIVNEVHKSGIISTIGYKSMMFSERLYDDTKGLFVKSQGISEQPIVPTEEVATYE